MYGQMYVMVHPCVLQDTGPLGPLPKKVKVKEKEGQGVNVARDTWHMTRGLWEERHCDLH